MRPAQEGSIVGAEIKLISSSRSLVRLTSLTYSYRPDTQKKGPSSQRKCSISFCLSSSVASTANLDGLKFFFASLAPFNN